MQTETQHEGTRVMTSKERQRAEVIAAVVDRNLRQWEAAELLGLTPRHVKRLVSRYRQEGPQGMISRRKGRPSGNATPAEERHRIVDLLRNGFADFAPGEAHRKLAEEHDCQLSVETIRKWMIEEGLWTPRTRRTA